MRSCPLLLAFSLLTSTFTNGQAPGVPIFDQSRASLKRVERDVGQQAEELMKTGNVLTAESIKTRMEKPEPVLLALKQSSPTELKPAEVARKALASSYRVGWAYLCPSCDHWHTNLGGGYAISDDGIIATCAHVVDPGKIKMRKGCLTAINHTGKVFPVTKIHAYHRRMDAALIRIEAETIGLALNDQVSPGDAAFCLSRPLSQGKYFTAGIVNRFFWNSAKRGKDSSSLEALAALKMNVSSRWAPGSSGSPVLDQAGNVIGHVATISNLGEDKNDKEDSLITLHSATPARSVAALATQKK
ncbi:MAG: S1 family peptidase [Akkermansiaceae bacterium]